MYYEVTYYHIDLFHAIGGVPIRDYGKPLVVGFNFGYDPDWTMNGKMVSPIGAPWTIREGD